MSGILLDTGVLANISRGRITWQDIRQHGAEPAIAAMTWAELQCGVELSKTPTERANRQRFNDLVVSRMPVINHDQVVASRLGELMAWVKRSGHPRGDADLEIAATALATNRTLITFDKKANFGALPGVQVVELS